ncbi:unnamed protein product [marine sediment metagenome]|uniref:Uncharacterized protein n=1 Tax=marine sediment metagenome TaxID=412755 RepID=X1K0V9_9ZZZZ
MGLMISSKSSDKEYSFGYSGLHQIRWITYRICGGKKNYVEFMSMQDGSLHRKDFKYPNCESFDFLNPGSRFFLACHKEMNI